jgi:hypothetical protein
MTAADCDGIVKRLDTLEKENARLTRESGRARSARVRLVLAGGAVIAAALTAIGAAAEKAPKVIEAEGFTMVGPDGKPRIKLLTNRNEQPALVFFGAAGQVRSVLELGRSGAPFLGLCDSKGSYRVGLTVNDDDSAAIVLKDGNGKDGVQLVSQPNGFRGLLLRDAQQLLAGLLVGAGGLPVLQFWDRDGDTRMTVSTLRDGSPAIIQVHKSKKVSANLIISDNGTPSLEMWDNTGKPLFAAPQR